MKSYKVGYNSIASLNTEWVLQDSDRRKSSNDASALRYTTAEFLPNNEMDMEL